MAVSNKIRDFFEKNIGMLSPYKRSHFAIRMYRLTGREKYARTARKYLVSQKKKFIQDIKAIDSIPHIKKRGNALYKKLEEFGTPEAKRKRKKVFRGKKEYLFYYSMIEKAHFLKEAGAFSGKDNYYYSKWKKFLKSADLKKLLLDKEIFREYSTQLVNLVYFLKTDGTADLGKDFRRMFENVFKGKLSSHMYTNRIYTMTHFIVAGSDYYQRLVSAKEFGWILDYFRKNIKEIIRKTNPDVVFEVGVCFKLAGEKSGKEIEMASEIAEKEYNPKIGYIPRKDKSPEQSEHANAIAIILLSDFKLLHKGPRI